MSVNADPKPGRWILPLVILGMIAFTYYFVRELPEAVPDTTIPSGAGPTTTVPDDSTTTTDPDPVDPEVQAYLDAVDTINSELQAAQIELVAANTGFDATPRTVEYPEAVTRFTAVVDDTKGLLTRFDALTAPDGLESNHSLLRTELDSAAKAAEDALAALRSPQPPSVRQGQVRAFVTAAEEFDTQVTALHTAAGS